MEEMLLVRTPSDLGAVIRERRIELGLDQSSLAAKAGTSRKWLIEVENGKPRAEIGLVFRTLKTLGLALAVTGAAAAEVRPRRAKAQGQTIDIDRIIDSLKKPG
jgi:HTH-type transcriptional regulator / antitoxin HipB